MKMKQTISLLAIALVAFFIGRFVGIKQGAEALKDSEIDGAMGRFNSGALNLVLIESGRLDDAKKMNEETVFWDVDKVHALLQEDESDFRTDILREMLLQARDIAELAKIDPYYASDDEMKKRKDLFELADDITIEINGEVFDEDPFEQKRKNIRKIFTQYEGQRSELYEFFKSILKSAEQGGGHNSGSSAASIVTP